MSDEHGRVDKSAAAELLSSAEQASKTMILSTDFSRIFLASYIAIWSVGLSLEHVLPGATEFWILSLVVPLGLIHYFMTRNRAKRRPITTGVGTNGIYGFLAVLAVLCLRAWEAENAWSVCAKMFISSTLLWHLCWKAKLAWDQETHEDSEKQAV